MMIEMVIAALTALVMGRPIIGALARLNIRQSIYSYAPESHRVKEGTPTMGGFIILLGVAVGLLAFAFLPHPAQPVAGASMPQSIPRGSLYLVPLLTFFAAAGLFALLGFLDDYLVRRWLGRRGLEWKTKLLLQALMAAVALYATASMPAQLLSAPHADGANAPALPSPALPLSVWLLALVWVVGWVNAFNLTDGLDGLAAGLSVIAFGILAALCRDTLSVITAMLWCGAALGYLWWNLHPAHVFMGDTGSMALGATFALITWRELMLAGSLSGEWLPRAALFVLIGLMFAIEIITVIIQLSAVKVLKRRIFRATPIHHHFELMGWQESLIVGRFWIAGALTGLMAYALSGGLR